MVDPLSIAASVGSLSGLCIVTIKRLSEVAGKFKDASKILQALSSETRVITSSLSQLHNILVGDKHTILTQALLTPDIQEALNVALTGCNVTLSCIENELSSLAAKISSNQKLNLTDRAKVAWKDDKFKELLQQLSRQHTAIGILQHGLQMWEILNSYVTLELFCQLTFRQASSRRHRSCIEKKPGSYSEGCRRH